MERKSAKEAAFHENTSSTRTSYTWVSQRPCFLNSQTALTAHALRAFVWVTSATRQAYALTLDGVTASDRGLQLRLVILPIISCELEAPSSPLLFISTSCASQHYCVITILLIENRTVQSRRERCCSWEKYRFLSISALAWIRKNEYNVLMRT